MKMKKSMDNSDKDKAIITLHKDRTQRLPAHDCGVGGGGVGGGVIQCQINNFD